MATLVMSVSYIDRQTLAVLGPTVVTALHLTLEQYGWVISAFSLAYLVGAPLAGVLLDRVGARRGLVVAVLAWSGVAASHALVPSFAALFALRVLLGTAEAPSFPGAAQTMKRILPREERSIGFGLLFTGSSIGAMVAAPVAIGILHASGDWRLAFLGTALLGLLWIPVWLVTTRSRLVRNALATAADDETSDPASLLALFTSAAVGRALLLVVFTAPSIMFGLNWSSHYLAHAFALSQEGLGRYIWLPPVGFDLGAVFFGALASRADRRARGRVSAIARGADGRGRAPLVRDGRDAARARPVARDRAHRRSCLAGGGGLFALLTADMLARVHPSQVSTAGGMTAAAQSLAYVVANPLVGRAVDTTRSYAVVLLVLGAIVPPAMVAWGAWPISKCESSTRCSA